MPARPTRQRRARLIGSAVLVPLLALSATACGDSEDKSADPTGVSAGKGLDALKVSGDFGKEPKVEFTDQVTVDKTEAETLIEGDGETVGEGDSVMAHLLVANGVDKAVTTSDFDSEPQLLTLGSQMMPSINNAVDGAKVGSRVVVASTPEDAFGEYGNPQIGIGNKDTAIFVIDIVSKMSLEPKGTEQKPAAWVPTITEDGGTPTGLDFAGKPKPPAGLQVSTLIRGDGEPTKKGQQIQVNYLGQVLGGKQPFDESFSKGMPYAVTLGKTGPGAVIQGWNEGLVGVPVGSRVVLSIPPSLGYGAKGNEGAGIKGTDTLIFVVDVLAAS